MNIVDETSEVYEVIGREQTVFGEAILRRYLCGPTIGYEIRLNGRYVMGTRDGPTERRLAIDAWSRLPKGNEPLAILVGGLGLGYMLDALLELDRIESVTLVEISNAVVGWCRQFGAGNERSVLDDSRVSIVIDDFYMFLRNTNQVFDLILVDIDNGPLNLAVSENCRLYGAEAMPLYAARLRSRGILAIWSSDNAALLAHYMRTEFGNIDAECVASGDVSLPPDVLYFSRTTASNTTLFV